MTPHQKIEANVCKIVVATCLIGIGLLALLQVMHLIIWLHDGVWPPYYTFGRFAEFDMGWQLPRTNWIVVDKGLNGIYDLPFELIAFLCLGAIAAPFGRDLKRLDDIEFAHRTAKKNNPSA